MVRSTHSSKQAALLFRALLQAPGAWHHGYALMQELGIASGSLYPLLIRLADDGLLESEWEVAEGNARPRRIYRLTTAGRSLARERLARFEAREGITGTPRGARA